MRAISVAATLVIGLCLLPTPARAGIYHPEEPGRVPVATFKQFRMRLGEIKRVAAESGPGDPTTREAFLAQVESIHAKEKQGPLSIVDRCNLGSCYLRLNRPTDAIAALKPVERMREDPSLFLALSTLATAYQYNGDLDTAESYLQQALRAWPSVYAHWSVGELVGFRRCERLQLTLIRSRRQEARLGPRRGEETLDPLFPGVSYTTATGAYEPAGMSTESRDALPSEPLDMLRQLVYWFPHDPRLYWQFGEMLNASGQIPEAYQVMNELADSGYSPPQLKEHRQVLGGVVKAANAWNKNRASNERALLLYVTPRGLGMAPGAGGAASEGAWAFMLGEANRSESWLPPTPPPPPPTPGGGMPDWQTVTVSAIFGALVALILRQQFRRPAREATAAGHGSG